MSIARLMPIRRGSRTVPPSISGTPQRRQNTPNTALLLGDAQIAPERELEAAGDRMAGHGGDHRLGQPHPRRAHRAVARRRLTRLPAAVPTAFRSAPAQNTPPSPCRTATAASASRSNSRNASASAHRRSRRRPRCAARGATAARCVTGPSRSTRTASPTFMRRPTARAHERPIAATTSSAGGPDPASGESGPTSASPQPADERRRGQLDVLRGQLAGGDRRPEHVRDQLRVPARGRRGARRPRAGRPARRAAPTPAAGCAAPARANVASTASSASAADAAAASRPRRPASPAPHRRRPSGTPPRTAPPWRRNAGIASPRRRRRGRRSRPPSAAP